MGILAEFYQTVASPLEGIDPRKAEILQVVANIPDELEITASTGFDGKLGKLYEVGSPGYIVDAMISRAAMLRYIQEAPMRPAEVLNAVCEDYPGIRRSVHVSSLYADLDGRQVFYHADDGLFHFSESTQLPVTESDSIEDMSVTEVKSGGGIRFARRHYRHPVVYGLRTKN